MEVLWRHGSATVAEVRDRLDEELAYTTVLTVLRVLEAKGYVGHEEEGRAHRYRPLVGREPAAQSAVGRLVSKLFGNSPELLLTHLVSDRKLSAEEVRRVRDLLDERLREDEG
jgi:predicted transcriptional regulator